MRTFAAALLVVIVMALASHNYAQRSPTDLRRAIVVPWNQLGESIDHENALLNELTRSFQLNPPWAVTDAREPAKRAKLIDAIIAEHRKRILLLEQIKREDR